MGLTTVVGETRDETTSLQYAAATSIWLLGLVTAVAVYGWPNVLDPIGLVFAAIWATFHFAIVAVAVLERSAGYVGIGVATVLAVAALVVVPRAVDETIEDDPSSTAALVHIFDPLLMAMPVGLALGVSWLLRRRATR